MESSRIDKLVRDAEERAKAARQLRDIFTQYPDLFNQFAGSKESNGAPVAKKPRKPRKKNQPITQIVIDYLQSKPGSNAAAIAEALHDQIKTSAENPKKVVYATLSSLLRRRKITSVRISAKNHQYSVAK